MKSKKTKTKSLAMWLVIGVLGLSMLGGVARASSDEFSWEVVMDKVALLLAEKVPQMGGLLGASGTRFPNGISADSTSPNAGEVRGTDLTSTDDVTVGDDLTVTGDLLSVEGLATYYNSVAMAAATTTPCAIQSPSVSSTLVFASESMSISSTTASTLTIAKATTAFATTTALMGELAVGANAKASYVQGFASTTDFIFAPSQWLVFSMQGGTGSFSPTGFCKALFNAIE